MLTEDALGNAVISVDNTFLTLDTAASTPDIAAPTISDVIVSNITKSSATISWTTNEDATSQVEYGTTSSYGSNTLIETHIKIHYVELINLNPDTNYYYRVRSKDASGNETISTGKTFHTNVEEIYSKKYEWDFMWYSWEYTTDIPKSTYDYFDEKPRVGDYSEYVLNPYDDDWMEDIANLFIEEANEKGWDESYYVPFALSFVQSMPYTSDKLTTGYDEYPRYPVETIVDEGGDCEDTSILFASIVREMGYGVVLLKLEQDEHMAVGVRISQSFINNWNHYYPLTYYTASDGSMYAYCETTAGGWELGQMPDGLVGTAQIIDVF